MRLIVLGIDGGTFDFINPMIDELPNFKKLMENGCYRTLKSITPPVSIPAWPCIFTGLDPSGLGTYDFMRKNRTGFTLPNVSLWKEKTLWKNLSDAGFKVGVVNVQGSHPPHKVNGFMLTGFNLKNNTYPEGLKINYKPIEQNGLTEKKLVSQVFESTIKGFETALDLFQRHETDFFTYVIDITDRITHNTKNMEIVKNAYKETDREIGILLENLGRDDKLILVSDHGITRAYKKIYLNSWLKEKGYLTLKKGKNPTLFRKIAEKLYTKGFSSLIKVGARILDKTDEVTLGNIDYSKTKAFAFASNGCRYMAIWLNSKNNFDFGIMDEKEAETIKQELKEELAREEWIEKVYEKHELYSGKHMDRMPDLVVKGEKGHVMVNNFSGNTITEADCFMHDENGIFIAYNMGNIEAKNLCDIAPLVRKHFNIKEPEIGEEKEIQTTKEDEEEIKKKLSQLGYF